jgi:di/tricarboxylate transporter
VSTADTTKISAFDSEDATKSLVPAADSKSLVPDVDSIETHKLEPGDIALFVTSEKNFEKQIKSKDFFVVTNVGALPKQISFYRAIPAMVFIVMLILVATDTITMIAGALTVAAFFFIGGWVKAEEIPHVVDLRLLMLIATSLSFATSMTASGLAVTIANTISKADPSPFGALMLVYAVTLVVTELISNNAAAALMYPIAVAIADSLKSDFKPFAMAVLISSTAGFMSPIGYQTHVMVWAPGGYKFLDFVKYGFFCDVLYWIGGCFLISVFLPFDGTVVIEMFADGNN